MKELHFGKTWQVGIRGHNCEDSGCCDNDDDNDSGAGDDGGGDVDVDGGDKKMKIRMLMMLMLMNIVMATRPLLFDI